jgi:hypothetical protein
MTSLYKLIRHQYPNSQAHQKITNITVNLDQPPRRVQIPVIQRTLITPDQRILCEELDSAKLNTHKLDGILNTTHLQWLPKNRLPTEGKLKALNEISLPRRFKYQVPQGGRLSRLFMKISIF